MYVLTNFIKNGKQCWTRAFCNSLRTRSEIQNFSSSSSSLFYQPNRNNDAGQQCTDNFRLATLTPMVQSVRNRGKPNVRRPKIPHKERAIVLALTNEKYKYPLEGLPATETCINAVQHPTKNTRQENPLERILSREFLAEVEAAEIMVMVHRHPCNSEDLFHMKIQLHRSNMKYLFHSNTVVKMGLEGTKYDKVRTAYSSKSATIVCYDRDFTKLLKLERKLPYITILGCVCEGQIMSVSQMKEAAALPALPMMRATLLATLGTQQQRLTQNLQHHQTDLSGSLSRHASEQQTDTAPDAGTS